MEEKKGRSRAVVWGYPESWRNVLLFSPWKNWQGSATWRRLSPACHLARDSCRAEGKNSFHESHVKKPYRSVPYCLSQRCFLCVCRPHWIKLRHGLKSNHILLIRFPLRVFLCVWGWKPYLEIITEAWLRSYDLVMQLRWCFFVFFYVCFYFSMFPPPVLLLRVMWNATGTTPRSQTTTIPSVATEMLKHAHTHTQWECRYRYVPRDFPYFSYLSFKRLQLQVVLKVWKTKNNS